MVDDLSSSPHAAEGLGFEESRAILWELQAAFKSIAKIVGDEQARRQSTTDDKHVTKTPPDEEKDDDEEPRPSDEDAFPPGFEHPKVKKMGDKQDKAPEDLSDDESLPEGLFGSLPNPALSVDGHPSTFQIFEEKALAD
eukprot:1224425-Pyramimonas_sp.AAC.1